MEVTTTQGKQGKFDAKFYHMVRHVEGLGSFHYASLEIHALASSTRCLFCAGQVFEEEIGTVKGHFGPINTVAFHPDGKG